MNELNTHQVSTRLPARDSIMKQSRGLMIDVLSTQTSNRSKNRKLKIHHIGIPTVLADCLLVFFFIFLPYQSSKEVLNQSRDISVLL